MQLHWNRLANGVKLPLYYAVGGETTGGEIQMGLSQMHRSHIAACSSPSQLHDALLSILKEVNLHQPN